MDRNRLFLPLDTPPRIKRIAAGVHERGTDPHFRLPGHWYFHIYSYEAELTLDGRRYEIRPGYAGLIPPVGQVEYRFYGRCAHLFAHFEPGPSTGQLIPFPVMQDLGLRYLPLTDAFHQAIQWFDSQPSRAEAWLWHTLWQLAASSNKSPAVPREPEPNHPAIRRVCQLIEQHLWKQLVPMKLADQVDLSLIHLRRLFRQQTGQPLAAYIRRRRALHARHLLQHTSLPIKTIAEQVGLPDPHLFNKIIRRELGVSPKAVRQGRGSPP